MNYIKSENEDSKTIKILQSGNSKYTVTDFPLFSIGSKYILFLTKSTEHDGYYRMVLEYLPLIAIENRNGKEYAINPFAFLHFEKEFKSIQEDPVKQGFISEYNINSPVFRTYSGLIYSKNSFVNAIKIKLSSILNN